MSNKVAVQFTIRQRLLIMGALFVLLLSLSVGPVILATQSNQNHKLIVELQSNQAGIQSLLNFVAQVSASGSSGNQSTEWYIREMQSICASLPNCNQVTPPPLPRITPPSTTATTIKKGT